MEGPLKSLLAGTISGVLTSFLALPAIGATAAIAMPSGGPVTLWSAFMVFGVGAFLPALIIHSSALLISRTSAFSMLASFCVAMIATIAVTSGLTYAGNAIAAFVVGAIAATLLTRTLWSNGPFKLNPLRGLARSRR